MEITKNFSRQGVCCRPWLLILIVFLFFSSSCRKDENTVQTNTVAAPEFKRPPAKPNPLSLRNIRGVKEKLLASGNAAARVLPPDIPDEQKLVYVKIDPAVITTQMVSLLDEDTTITLLDFPFANGEIYELSFGLNEQKADSLKDGYLYAVLPIQNRIFSSLNIPFTRLDTLYKPVDEEDPLVGQALVEGGYITQEELNLRICFRRPEGFVRYRDSDLGANQPVIGMQVFAIAFGVPIHTYTNETGWFRIGWKFLFGSLIGTKAKNDRVNIKPVVTNGIWIATIIPQFLVGSVHIHGMVSACNINSININFNNHRQNRFWSHILNAVHFHDQFTAQDNILNAPRKITIWAHWADNYGGASAPMLGHIPGSLLSLLTQYFSSLLGVDITNYQNIFNVLIGGLPDITLRSGSTDRVSYSPDLMQTAFHELGHASHYRAAGNEWWKDLMWAEIFPNGDCGGYGCGNGKNDGLVQLAESWAEFIGTTHALRRYPNSEMRAVFFRNIFTNPEGFVRLDVALEDEDWFVNNWIPTGIFNDLRDAGGNPGEPWDNVQGATIQQIFSPFDPTIRTPCDYYARFTQLYWSIYGFQPVLDIFNNHGINCAL